MLQEIRWQTFFDLAVSIYICKAELILWKVFKSSKVSAIRKCISKM